MPRATLSLDAFQQFCLQTGRTWENYSHILLMLEFAEWAHMKLVQADIENEKQRTAYKGRPNCF